MTVSDAALGARYALQQGVRFRAVKSAESVKRHCAVAGVGSESGGTGSEGQ